jgi:hypothetical protein
MCVLRQNDARWAWLYAHASSGFLSPPCHEVCSVSASQSQRVFCQRRMSPLSSHTGSTNSRLGYADSSTRFAAPDALGQAYRSTLNSIVYRRLRPVHHEIIISDVGQHWATPSTSPIARAVERRVSSHLPISSNRCFVGLRKHSELKHLSQRLGYSYEPHLSQRTVCPHLPIHGIGPKAHSERCTTIASS